VIEEEMKTKWKSKILQGQYIRNLDAYFINEEGTYF
jgi:hypothetical protein